MGILKAEIKVLLGQKKEKEGDQREENKEKGEKKGNRKWEEVIEEE